MAISFFTSPRVTFIKRPKKENINFEIKNLDRYLDNFCWDESLIYGGSLLIKFIIPLKHDFEKHSERLRNA